MSKITHKIYGEGRVISQRYGGFEFKVEFDNGIIRWVRFNDISYQNLSEVREEKSLVKPTVPLSTKQFDARQVIESLRMGVVPFKAIDHFTVGRDKEISQAQKWLSKKNKNGSMFIRGEYGSGKSHLLEYFRLMALNDGWAVSFVEVGLEENPFYKPYMIYREMVKNFRAKIGGRELNFRSFLKMATENDDSDMLNGHLFFGKMKDLLRFDEEEEKVWEWIEGDYDWYRPKLYRMGTASNIYCYLINGISRIAEELLGLKGFLLLFDEAEFINESDYSYQLSKGKTFLKALTYLSDNKRALVNEKISHLKFGRSSGLQYCGLPRNKPIRFAWELPSNLKIIFAMTPIDGFPGQTIELNALKKSDLKLIVSNIIRYYKIAYNMEFNNLDVDIFFNKLPKEKTRKFIKQVIEILDIKRFYPKENIKKLLESYYE